MTDTPTCPICHDAKLRVKRNQRSVHGYVLVRGLDGLSHLCVYNDAGGHKTVSFVAVCGHIPSSPLAP